MLIPMTMCVENTPLEDYREQFGLFVKREDLCCPGGPNFSKTRGVWAHIAKRPEKFIGVLDTSHSQGGWAVARACQLLGKQCINFYPQFKGRNELPEVQVQTRALGAQLCPLPAGRSAILFHQARKWLAGHEEAGQDSYMMPNALKLEESVSETAEEVHRTFSSRLDGSRYPALVSASSGTIAAGVLRGLLDLGWRGNLIVHLGYSRPADAVIGYIRKMARCGDTERITVVDEGYNYADRARGEELPPFPCNQYYDLKAWQWWVRQGRMFYNQALFWNVG